MSEKLRHGHDPQIISECFAGAFKGHSTTWDGIKLAHNLSPTHCLYFGPEPQSCLPSSVSLSLQIIFSEDYQRVEDLAWHRKHFICEGCEQLLSGRAYIVTKGQLLCPTCSKSKRSWSVAHPLPESIGSHQETEAVSPLGRIQESASSAYSRLSGGRSLGVHSFETRGILRSLRMNLLFPNCS